MHRSTLYFAAFIVFPLCLWTTACGTSSGGGGSADTSDVGVDDAVTDDAEPETLEDGGVDDTTDEQGDDAADEQVDDATDDTDDDGCASNADCVGEATGEVCDTDTNQCVECLVENDCVGHASGERCHLTYNVCVECLSGDDCQTALLPLCHLDAGVCVECLSNTDCVGDPDGEVCGAGNVCGGETSCSGPSDCSGNPDGDVCDVDTGDCVECLTEADCVGNPDGPECGPGNVCFTPAGCINHTDCDGDPAGEVCDVESGDCVECLISEHCDGNPSGWRCGGDNECFTPDGCINHDDCDGDPSGELCIFFEERCGECLYHSDCLEGQRCNPSFECVALTDEICAAENPSRPYVVGTECVDCRTDDHCTYSTYVYCSSWNDCIECRQDDHCTEDTDEPYCLTETGHCAECATNDHCPDELCDISSSGRFARCDECAEEQCPEDTPYCSWAVFTDQECVECTSDYDCDWWDNYYCDDGVCVFEAIPCDSNSDCSDNTELDQCPDADVEGRTCVECDGNFDCRIWGIVGDDVCDVETGTCVDCLDDDDCVHDDRPFCHTDGYCSECRSDVDCTGNPEGSACSDVGRCQECIQDIDCEGNPNGDYCRYDLSCAECVLDEHCDEVGAECSHGECVIPAECTDRFSDCSVDPGIYLCDSYVDNCGGRFNCGTCGGGGTCSSGGRDCLCPLDDLDLTASNNTSETATDLGEFSDNADDDARREGLTIHSSDDEDWFRFDAVDATGGGFNPDVFVAVRANGDEVGDESAYEITMWIDCHTADDGTVCDGAPVEATADGIGWTHWGWGFGNILAEVECTTTTDTATVTLRVRKTERFGRCDSYSLEISVD